jgi:hydroxymethylglutaryl-CoA lyase
VPQMAGSAEVMAGIKRPAGVKFSVLTPNMQGFKGAMEAKADEVAVFASASEGFSKKNTNCSIEESVARFKAVCDAAAAENIPVRGYVSCVVGCPYQGHVEPSEVGRVAKYLLDAGCYEISLGDTIGVGTPGSTINMLEAVEAAGVPMSKCAVHFHDTYGLALANILASLQVGVTVVDSSVAGLGGCPYAGPTASGNVATEDLVHMLHGMGVSTGINFEKLLDTSKYISDILGRDPASRTARTLLAKRSLVK